MRKLFSLVLKESPLDSPFAPKEKCSDFLPFLGFMGDMLGASLNQDNVNNTNATNLKIAELNNMRQQQQFDENMSWLRYQYNKNRQYALEDRDYNEPTKVVQRLLAAGINPSSYFGQGATQIASSQGVGAPSPSSFHSPIMQASMIGSDIGGSVGRAINAYNESRLATSEVRKNESTSNNIDAVTHSISEKLPYEINKLKADSYKQGLEGEFARTQLDFYGATMDLRSKLLYGDLLQQNQSLMNMQESYRGMQIQNDINEIYKAYADSINEAQLKQIRATISQIDANIGLINSNRMLTDEQRKTQIQTTISSKIENGLKGIDFKVKKACENLMINDARNRSKMLNYDAQQQGVREIRDLIQGFVPFGGIGRKL